MLSKHSASNKQHRRTKVSEKITVRTDQKSSFKELVSLEKEGMSVKCFRLTSVHPRNVDKQFIDQAIEDFIYAQFFGRSPDNSIVDYTKRYGEAGTPYFQVYGEAGMPYFIFESYLHDSAVKGDLAVVCVMEVAVLLPGGLRISPWCRRDYTINVMTKPLPLDELSFVKRNDSRQAPQMILGESAQSEFSTILEENV